MGAWTHLNIHSIVVVDDVVAEATQHTAPRARQLAVCAPACSHTGRAVQGRTLSFAPSLFLFSSPPPPSSPFPFSTQPFYFIFLYFPFATRLGDL
jgi:hypothetical protein